MIKTTYQKLKPVLFPITSILILVLLSQVVEWEKLAATFRRAELFPLFAAFVVTLPFPLLNTLRWTSVLRAVNAPISLRRAFVITMACWPIGVLTPGKAGELLKATVLPDKVIGVGTVFAERIIDLFILGLFGVVFGIAIGSAWCILGGLAGVGGALTILIGAKAAAGLLSGKRIAIKLNGLIAVLPRLISQPRLLAACALSSATNWFLSMVQMWFFLEAFHAPTPLLKVMAIVPGATFAGLVPIPTAGGAGPREAAFMFLGSGHIEEAPLLAAAVMYSLFGYFMLGAMGLPFLGALRRKHSGDAKSGSTG